VYQWKTTLTAAGKEKHKKIFFDYISLCDHCGGYGFDNMEGVDPMAKNLEVLTAKVRDWQRETYFEGTGAAASELADRFFALIAEVDAEGIDLHSAIEEKLKTDPLWPWVKISEEIAEPEETDDPEDPGGSDG
jgi:hypothetical protein